MLEIAKLFLWLGCIGFGGPQAHIALMQQEVLEKRKWLNTEEFTEGLAVCNLLPGPASTQLAVYIGWIKGRLRGGLLAGICFIFPAFCMMLALSWLYFAFGTLPQLAAFFYGLKPVVVSIVLATTWRLAKPNIRDWRFWLLVIISCILISLRLVNDFLVFLGAALAGIILYRSLQTGKTSKPIKKKNGLQQRGWVFSSGITLLIGGFFDNAGDLTRLAQLGWFFLRAGALIFGGGLVIIPFVQNEVVSGFGWMNVQQFTDGVALGQVTPGPVLVTATFVGYAVAGLSGALVATIAIFTPGFMFILLAAPHLQRVKNYPIARSALQGVNGAVIGSLLAGAYFVSTAAFILPRTQTGGIDIGEGKILDPYTVFISLVSLFLLVRYKVNTIWLFALAGGIGIVLNLISFRLPGMSLP
jgi:chromate transporter